MKSVQICLVSATIYICTILSSSAQSFSQKQQNAMNHVAQVLAAIAFCPEFESNDAIIVLLGMHYNFTISDEKTKAIIVAKAREHKAGLEKVGKTAGCLAAWALYGPGGQNVPDLIRRK